MFYSQTEMLEKFSQMMATGEFFDVMFPGGTNSYSGGYQQGISALYRTHGNTRNKIFLNKRVNT